jgi:tetratricopeptide (TPR) repeat protein
MLMLRTVLHRLVCPAFICVLCTPAFAQGSAVAPKPAGVSCAVRKAPLSPGDLAYTHAEYSKAIDLYREESKAAGEVGDHAHNALIRSLLRSEKVDEADQDAVAWAAKAPHNAWAVVSLGEVHLRKAEIDDAGESLRSAAAIDFCNPQVHADYAEYLDFSGYHASAKTQIEIAHKLDPIDDDISATWLHYQPRSARLAAVNAYLERSKFLTDHERKSWETERDALMKPPQFPCRLANAIDSATIPFDAIRDGNAVGGQASNVEWGFAVSINGKTRHLELDTGAHGLILKHSAATALGLDIEAHSAAIGLGEKGAVSTSIAKVKSIKIGGLEFTDCAVDVFDKDIYVQGAGRAYQVMEGQDGLIGGDVFQNFLLTLDFPGHLVKLDPLPHPQGPLASEGPSMVTGAEAADSPLRDRVIDPSMASWTKVFRDGHDLIIPVRVNSGPTHLFIVDTGAHSSIISPAAAREVGHLEKGIPGLIMGVSGEVKDVYSTGPLTLDFAGLRQPSPGLVATDSGLKNNHIEISGLLGQLTLHQLTVHIDYRDQLIHFVYDPSRLAHCVANVTLDDCY